MRRLKQERILVLGAGYGGLQAALRLSSLLGKNCHARIQLVDQTNFHLLQTRLHEAAAGSISCEDVIIPIPRLIQHKQIEFTRARVVGIDYAAHTVDTTAGPLRYDYLVIALGSQTDFFGIPGLAESAFTLKSMDDACRIRAHLKRMISLAAKETDRVEKRRLLTFVIGGGGFTGTELAGELADNMRPLAARQGLAPRDVRIMIVEASKGLLSGFDPNLSRVATRVLKSKGVEMLFGDPVVKVEDASIYVKSGGQLETKTLIWTGGVRANEIVPKSGLSVGAKGRAVVTPRLQSVDHPEVYLIGDDALAVDWRTGRPLGPSAQLALHHAGTTAYNIYADIKGLPKKISRPNLRGEIVSLGKNDAVAMVGPFRIAGRAARILKYAVHLRYLYTVGGPKLLLEYQLGTRKAPSARKQGRP